MPANLNNPFGESCCDGGECTPNDLSAQPCGCDKGANYVAPSCTKHRIEEAFKAGYHCQWIVGEGQYIFDPLMKPGDPDGAFKAWQEYNK